MFLSRCFLPCICLNLLPNSASYFFLQNIKKYSINIIWIWSTHDFGQNGQNAKRIQKQLLIISVVDFKKYHIRWELLSYLILILMFLPAYFFTVTEFSIWGKAVENNKNDRSRSWKFQWLSACTEGMSLYTVIRTTYQLFILLCSSTNPL